MLKFLSVNFGLEIVFNVKTFGLWRHGSKSTMNEGHGPLIELLFVWLSCQK